MLICSFFALRNLELTPLSLASTEPEDSRVTTMTFGDPTAKIFVVDRCVEVLIRKALEGFNTVNGRGPSIA